MPPPPPWPDQAPERNEVVNPMRATAGLRGALANTARASCRDARMEPVLAKVIWCELSAPTVQQMPERDGLLDPIRPAAWYPHHRISMHQMPTPCEAHRGPLEAPTARVQ